MIDFTCRSLLQDLFRREGRSLLQYASESSPWVDEKDKHLEERLKILAEAEIRALGEFAEYLEKARVPLPYLGAYPSRFTNYNFMNLRKLLTPLIQDQRDGVNRLEKEIQSLQGKDREEATKILEINRQHLMELEKLRE
jgi:hypothetical protein